MPTLNAITPAQLFRQIGSADAPAIIDVRLPEDVATDPRLIPTAAMHGYSAMAALAPTLAGRRAVIVCQRGRKLSEGAAALLRLYGIAAEVLEGGSEAWAEAKLPLVPLASFTPGGIWVTRHRPKVDRIACPWLIRRFVDPAASFLFVAPSEVMGVAERFNATPFDVEDVHWSHRDDRCTFDTMVEEFGLSTATMDRLATVIRAADTDRHDLAPQAAGLLALSVGLSRLYKDDLEQLEAGMLLYDALYRWARDGFDEGHDWPAGRA